MEEWTGATTVDAATARPAIATDLRPFTEAEYHILLGRLVRLTLRPPLPTPHAPHQLADQLAAYSAERVVMLLASPPLATPPPLLDYPHRVGYTVVHDHWHFAVLYVQCNEDGPLLAEPLVHELATWLGATLQRWTPLPASPPLTARRVGISAAQLSSREQEVFVLVVQDWSTKAIAQRFALSPRTISAYRSRILTKLLTMPPEAVGPDDRYFLHLARLPAAMSPPALQRHPLSAPQT